tara:strand:- start:314 stop:463 length:150 start_codon:yes stop_codon:yes gene_type:complete
VNVIAIMPGMIHIGEINPVPTIIAVTIVPDPDRKNKNDLNECFIVIVLV